MYSKLLPSLLFCVSTSLLFISCGKEETEVVPHYGLQKTVDRDSITRKPTKMEKSTKIAYESTLNGGYDIYTINADGTNLKQLTRNMEKNRFPTWSPDGSKIIFSSSRNRKTSFEFFIMNADGSNHTRLPFVKGWCGRPGWSPDGKKVLFDAGLKGNFEIFTMNLDGTDLVNISNNPSWDGMADWSPDGTKILFVSNRDVDHEIFVMNTDGTNVIKLTDNEYKDTTPSWSPDGTQIVFVSDRDHKFEVEVKPLSKDEDPGSPEFLERAMQSKRDHDIFVMNADGSNPVNITRYPNNDFKPTWSPDGTRIAFISIRDGKRELFSMNSDGSEVVPITNNDSMDEYPDWGPMPK
ncbi:hypothetical protein ACFL30_00060 [Candidatus Latescibacterota bacterium]